MSSLITTGNSAASWSPDVNTFAPDTIVPEALITQTSTRVAQVDGDSQFVRAAFIRDGVAGFVPEGDEIEIDNPELDEVVIATGKVAKLARLSNEQYHQSATAPMIARSFGRSLTAAADAAYIAAPNPAAPALTPPGGLLNASGIVDGGVIDGNLDALVAGIAEVEGNLAQPTHIVASPEAWGRLRQLRVGTDYNATLLGAGTEDAARVLLGLPVLVSPFITGSTLMVLDKSAIVSAIGDVRVAVSEHALFNATRPCCARPGVLVQRSRSRSAWRSSRLPTRRRSSQNNARPS
ncbi:MAG: phage major capsid protein [Promicromonosporaceae bacterium]|nr:phage major capsid protein [Promicromonosporaceae bacterium]